MEFVLTFIKLFGWAIYFVSPILFVLAAVIVTFGQIVTQLERWNRFDGLYWSFVTATTVGYGDLRPEHRLSKIISIFIALNGIIFTGIILAAAVKTVSMSFEMHMDPAIIQKIKENI